MLKADRMVDEKAVLSADKLAVRLIEQLVETMVD